MKVLILLLISTTAALEAHGQVDFIWGRQMGTAQNEVAFDVLTDSQENVYIYGNSTGKIGNGHLGGKDGFISKIDSNGSTQWTQQIGTGKEDEIKHTVYDRNRTLYMVGYQGAKMVDNRNQGGDILVISMDTSGTINWQKTYGTDAHEEGLSIALGREGDLFITGITFGTFGEQQFGKTDAFILKLDSTGNQLNIVQFGTPEHDRGMGLVCGADSSIYVAGFTGGKLGNRHYGDLDAFWARYDEQLQLMKLEQFGTEMHDMVSIIRTDDQCNVYLAGSTAGDLGKPQVGRGDNFIRKLNPQGDLQWQRQFGTEKWDGVNGVEIIGDKIVVSGCQNWPSCESFCTMFDADGNRLWSRTYTAQGAGGGTCGKGICITHKGFIYQTGNTGGSLFSNITGDHDLFILKLKLHPEINNLPADSTANQ